MSSNELWEPARWGLDPREDRLRQLLLGEGVDEPLAEGFARALGDSERHRRFHRRELLEEFAEWANTHTHGGGGGPVAVPDEWEVLTDMPDGRYQSLGGVLGDHLYVIGGRNDAGQVRGQVYIYDLSAGTWSSGTSCPINISNAPSAIDPAGYIYVGPFTSQGSVYRYDVGADSWSALSAAPGFGVSAMGCFFDGDYYVLGGGYDASFKYDPGSGGWLSVAAPVIPGRRGGLLFVHDGTLFLAGGQDDATSDHLDSIEEYDLVGDSWSTRPETLARAVEWTAYGLISGRLVTVGGNTAAATYTDDTHLGDAGVPSSWETRAPDPYGGHFGALGSVWEGDNRLYVAGGTGGVTRMLRAYG